VIANEGLRPEAEAQRLLTGFPSGTVRTPVDKIARQLGAILSYEPLHGGVSGMLLRRNGRVIIGVNSREAPTRQRFTLAHEIGHWLLHPGRSLVVDRQIRISLRDRRSSMATDREEIEANAFAACLLMPSSRVRDQAEALLHHRPSASQTALVSTLSDAFEVSSQAMEIRLTNLGVIHPR
jgi:Zn-dependent peptidase ImmA (M78 family)